MSNYPQTAEGVRVLELEVQNVAFEKQIAILTKEVSGYIAENDSLSRGLEQMSDYAKSINTELETMRQLMGVSVGKSHPAYTNLVIVAKSAEMLCNRLACYVRPAGNVDISHMANDVYELNASAHEALKLCGEEIK